MSLVIISEILKKEILLFNKLLEIEKQKQKSIINANGSILKNTSLLSEKYMTKLQELDKDLFFSIAKFTKKEKNEQEIVTLKELLKYSTKIGEKEVKSLEKLALKYEVSVNKLREAVQANQELMMNANKKIQSLLNNLQKIEAQESQSTYKPSKQGNNSNISSSNSGKLLNMGA